MGLFNIVHAPWHNPATGATIDIAVQFKYGATRQLEYRVGDTLEWGYNEVGEPGVKHVVVYGVLDFASKTTGASEDYEIHIVDNVIDRVVPTNKGEFDDVIIKH